MQVICKSWAKDYCVQNTFYAKNPRLAGISQILEYHISLFASAIRLLIGKRDLRFLFSWLLVSKDFEQSNIQ